MRTRWAEGDAAMILALLDGAFAPLITDIDGMRWTGRPGYPTRSMVALSLVKALAFVRTWQQAIDVALACPELAPLFTPGPSGWMCYRFVRKLRTFESFGSAEAGALAELLATTAAGPARA